ncbi:MAG: hypothetical protein ABW139_20440 [Candidatus Thiodiazotropha sp. DIVDIV]
MGMLGSIGGMVGGVVGGMFGGPLGAQLGSQIGGGIGGMLEGLISQHGQSNVQGAMNNNMMGSLVSQLGQAIQSAPGIPQFARDEMCQGLQSAHQSCPQEPTPPGCQRDTDDAMSGLIDKIVDKVVDQIMDKLQGGECESGDFGDLLRDAVEDVVREKIDGGCDGNGDTATADPVPGDGGSCTRTEGDSDTADAHTNAAYSTAEAGAEENEDKCGSEGNWLVALAGALAKVQQKFLNAAMENMATMEKNGDSAVSGSDQTDAEKETQRNDFLEAQSQYQANMQMFNMVANMTATSLKTLGEGLTSIARKQ